MKWKTSQIIYIMILLQGTLNLKMQCVKRCGSCLMKTPFIKCLLLRPYIHANLFFSLPAS